MRQNVIIIAAAGANNLIREGERDDENIPNELATAARIMQRATTEVALIVSSRQLAIIVIFTPFEPHYA